MTRDLVSTALERWARERGEEPLLFYRDALGRMRWWSASRTRDLFRGGPARGRRESSAGGDDAAALPGRFLDVLCDGEPSLDASVSHAAGLADRPALDLSLAAAAVAEAVGLPGVGAPRDLWVSWRSPGLPEERALALWALASGAAILVEPCERMPAWLVAWARPTLWSGPEGVLLELLEGIAVEAPRFSTRRWQRQRFERLRAVLVEGNRGDGSALDAVRRGLLAAGCASAPRIAPFPRLALE